MKSPFITLKQDDKPCCVNALLISAVQEHTGRDDTKSGMMVTRTVVYVGTTAFWVNDKYDDVMQMIREAYEDVASETQQAN